MLKSYKQFFQEVELLPYYKKSNKLGTYVGDDFDNSVKRLERYAKGSGGLKHLEVSKLDKDHTLHHFNIDNSLGQHDFIVKHKGKVSHHIITTSHRDNVHHIDAVASSGESPIKAHDVYHHMLKRGNTLVSNAHTRGGEHVWRELQKKRDVNIHGWDDYKNKPVNVDMKGDPEETHIDNNAAILHDIDNPEFRKTKDMLLVAHIKDKDKK